MDECDLGAPLDIVADESTRRYDDFCPQRTLPCACMQGLCLVFPGLHIVLLDSDCVPITLFEVEDLWQEALQPPKAPCASEACPGTSHQGQSTGSPARSSFLMCVMT